MNTFLGRVIGKDAIINGETVKCIASADPSFAVGEIYSVYATDLENNVVMLEDRFHEEADAFPATDALLEELGIELRWYTNKQVA